MQELSGWTLGMTGRVSLTTGTLEATEDGDPWSLGTGDGIDDFARMI